MKAKMTTCNHDDSKRHAYIFKLGPVAEVHMCECGALVNIAHADGETRAMTAGELDAVIADLLDTQRARLLTQLHNVLKEMH